MTSWPMTLQRFRELLRRIDPKLQVRVRGTGDVVGVFVGTAGKGGYICRMSKGELQLNGYRWALADPKNPFNKLNGRIKKRGRKTVINLLRNYRWVQNHYQRSMLTWGIDYPDHLVKGLTQGDTSHGK
jgi:hypothetical protein